MRALAAIVVALAVVPAAAQATVPATAQARLFGIVGNSAQYTALAAMHPSIRAGYVGFGEDVVPTLTSDGASKATAMFTWTSVSTLSLAQLAAGQADPYLIRTAKAIRAFRAPVYIRFDQEMNGNWFAWSGDPTDFVTAWRHIWNVFRAAGANNVRWIWGPDLVVYEPITQWESVAAYWPGGRYVDVVGPTFVEFASQTNCEVLCRFARIDRLRAAYHKPVWLAETKVNQAERDPWLRSLRVALSTRPWVRALVWSESPSRGQATGQVGTGNMDWSLTSDPLARSLLSTALKA